MKTAIVTDSTFYMDKQFIIDNNINIVQLSVNFTNATFKEDIDDVLTMDEIFKRIKDTKVLPSTSQPSTMAFLNKFDELIEQGYERILLFTLSSNLSGTYQNAVLSAREKMEVSDVKIEVYDSKNVAHGAVIMLNELIRYMDKVEKNIKSEKIEEIIDFYGKYAKIYLVVDSLNYLSYGGRISPTVAAAGNLFGIKPLLIIEEGIVKEHSKCRSTKKAYKSIIELFQKEYNDNPQDYYIYSAHTHNPKDAGKLTKYIADIAKDDAIVFPVISLGPVISMHSGPGTVGIVWAPKFFN
ncbi:MAG: DegV family protein [Mycoplasmatales bacterium]